MTYDCEVILYDGDNEILVEVSYRVTSWGAEATPPSYACGGEPAEPPEFEIDSMTVNGVEFVPTDEQAKKINEAIWEDISDIELDYPDD